ncbi:MAG: hypothetical protein PHG65_02300, partial [Kiritimatiellae bacterium]|nr:hypothetical protein [Kiritimatiellia bacterium]
MMNLRFGFRYAGVLAVFFVFSGFATCGLATGLYEPGEGVYLGVIQEGLDGTNVTAFQEVAQKDTTIFGCYVDITQALAVVNFSYYFTNWAGTVRQTVPNAGLLVVMEPKGCFTNFSVNWQPGSYYDTKTCELGYMLKSTEMPVFLTFAHEANGAWYEWSPAHPNDDLITEATYCQAWSNFATVVKTIAPNV